MWGTESKGRPVRLRERVWVRVRGRVIYIIYIMYIYIHTYIYIYIYYYILYILHIYYIYYIYIIYIILLACEGALHIPLYLIRQGEEAGGSHLLIRELIKALFEIRHCEHGPELEDLEVVCCLEGVFDGCPGDGFACERVGE